MSDPNPTLALYRARCRQASAPVEADAPVTEPGAPETDTPEPGNEQEPGAPDIVDHPKAPTNAAGKKK